MWIEYQQRNDSSLTTSLVNLEKVSKIEYDEEENSLAFYSDYTGIEDIVALLDFKTVGEARNTYRRIVDAMKSASVVVLTIDCELIDDFDNLSSLN